MTSTACGATGDESEDAAMSGGRGHLVPMLHQLRTTSCDDRVLVA
jgi:hypothetical protein